MFSISAHDPDGRNSELKYDEIPDTCPVCHRAIHVEQLGSHGFVSQRGGQGGWLQILYRCPATDCGIAFVATYNGRHQTGSGGVYYFFFERLDPRNPQPPPIEQPIRDVSPAFVSIYTQAIQAERAGLSQICGGGFRRALEFLIKDYLISKNPENAEKIKSSFLGTCISQYIADENIKTCASGANWLGTDQTHYERRYEKHDILHLKELIRLTMFWMNSELLTAKYKAELRNSRV